MRISDWSSDVCSSDLAETLEADLAEAIEAHGLATEMDAKSMALHTQAVLQGAFILAKGKDDAAIVIDSIAHLSGHFELLFNNRPSKEKRSGRPRAQARRGGEK